MSMPCLLPFEPVPVKGKRTKMKRPSQNYPLVEIWWNDATEMPSGWIEATEAIEIKPCIVLSIGFLVKETDEYIIIAIDTHDGGHNGRSQIPKGMVKYMRVVRKADAEKGPPAAIAEAKP